MKRVSFLFLWACLALQGTGQDIRVTFCAISDPGRIDQVTARNLKTGQQVTLPGDGTLVLGSLSGISLNAMTGAMTAFPNPFPGTTRVYSDITRPGKVSIRLSDAAGRILSESMPEVPAGRLTFDIGVKSAGRYTVTVGTGSGTFSRALICTGESPASPGIRLVGSGENPGQPPLKSGRTEVSLGYSTGDVVFYSCICGSFTTVFTDKPVFSKIYPVQFEACTDPGGQSYPVIQVGGQHWMAANLAWLPEVSPSSAGSDSLPLYYVYSYEGTDAAEAMATGNFQDYGVLYNWTAALTACPEGWHLPSDMEWMILEKTLGMYDTWITGWRPSGEVDRKLKSMTGWKRDGNGDNSSGFDIPPAGCRLSNQTGFAGTEGQVFFWTSTPENPAKAWTRSLAYLSLGVNRVTEARDYGFSVRCIRNEE